MKLDDGYTEVPAGKVASIVTYLEMFTPPHSLALASSTEFLVRKVIHPDLAWYRELYRAVGQEWLWFSRLGMKDEQLINLIRHPDVDIYELRTTGDSEPRGLVELDRRSAPDIEITSFGVTPDLVGKGAGKLLMDFILRTAWSHNPRRIWLHTCTLDHPRALPFYIKAGFLPYKRAVEIADDPRLTGLIDSKAGSHLPSIPEKKL